MNTLEHLAAQALLGTNQRAPVWSGDDSVFGQVIQDLAQHPVQAEKNAPTQGAGSEPGADAALRVLRAAGVLAVCGRAGYQPAIEPNITVGVCAEEKLPCLQDGKIIDLLHKVFTDNTLRLQLESLHLLRRQQQLLPPRLLPQLLELARQSTPIRSLMSDCMGERGHWLAGQNPHWNVFVNSADALSFDAWEHGNLAQRTVYLAQVRNQSPDQARTLFSQSLSDMDARERAALLEVLLHGLSMEDEDLLESLLKDRSKEVRQLSASMLARLPQSRFVQRMTQRLSACVRQDNPQTSDSASASTSSKQGGFLKRIAERLTAHRHSPPTWVIEPPEQFGADWKHDTLEEKLVSQQDKDMGQRAWWLYQIARYVPLSWWTDMTQHSPKELLQWMGQTDWSTPLFRAWYESLLRDTHETCAAWVQAVLAEMPNQKFYFEIFKTQVNAFELITKLPALERQPLWLKWLRASCERSKSIALGDLLGHFLETIPVDTDAHPLSPDMSHELIRCLHDWIRQTRAQHDDRLRHVMADFACVLHPDAMPMALQAWPLDPEGHPLCVEAQTMLFTTMEQRQRLHQFFDSAAIQKVTHHEQNRQKHPSL